MRNPAILKEGAVWAGEQYFIMPFDESLQACVLATLPQK